MLDTLHEGTASHKNRGLQTFIFLQTEHVNIWIEILNHFVLNNTDATKATVTIPSSALMSKHIPPFLKPQCSAFKAKQ